MFALAALAWLLAWPLLQAALTVEVHAQTANDSSQPAGNSLFQPALIDPRYPPRFNAPPGSRAGSQPPAPRAVSQEPVPSPRATIPSGAGETGFDATGVTAKKKKNQRKPGDPRPLPPPPPKPRGPPQAAEGHTLAQQIGQRDAYKVPDTPPRRTLVPFQDPYEPLGIRAGSLLLKPSIDVTRGYDTNPGHSSTGKGSGYTVIEPALKVRSAWAVHEFGADVRGTYSKFDSLQSLDRPMAEAKTYLRFDASRDTAINLEGRYLLSTDYPGSPNVPADVVKLPMFTTYGTSLGLTQRFNHFEVLAKAGYDRTDYQDSDLSDGTKSSNHDRDLNQFSGQLRGSYEVFPGVKPFVEILADTRLHDIQLDRNGFQRDSKALTPKIGTTFELTRKLTGEVSAGYLERNYTDPNLLPIRAVVYDASLKWELSGLTTATLTASSRGDESVVAGWSGALRRDVGIQVDHALRRWLIWTVKAGYGVDDYINNASSVGRADTRVSLGSAITYKLNRDFWLKGEYRYDQLRSSAAGSDYSANAFLVGLKLQR